MENHWGNLMEFRPESAAGPCCLAAVLQVPHCFKVEPYHGENEKFRKVIL